MKTYRYTKHVRLPISQYQLRKTVQILVGASLANLSAAKFKAGNDSRVSPQRTR